MKPRQYPAKEVKNERRECGVEKSAKKKTTKFSIKAPIQEPGVPVQVIPRCFNSFFVSVEWIFIIGQLLFRFISVYVINTANRF